MACGPCGDGLSTLFGSGVTKASQALSVVQTDIPIVHREVYDRCLAVFVDPAAAAKNVLKETIIKTIKTCHHKGLLKYVDTQQTADPDENGLDIRIGNQTLYVRGVKTNPDEHGVIIQLMEQLLIVARHLGLLKGMELLLQYLEQHPGRARYVPGSDMLWIMVKGCKVADTTVLLKRLRLKDDHLDDDAHIWRDMKKTRMSSQNRYLAEQMVSVLLESFERDRLHELIRTLDDHAKTKNERKWFWQSPVCIPFSDFHSHANSRRSVPTVEDLPTPEIVDDVRPPAASAACLRSLPPQLASAACLHDRVEGGTDAPEACVATEEHLSPQTADHELDRVQAARIVDEMHDRVEGSIDAPEADEPALATAEHLSPRIVDDELDRVQACSDEPALAVEEHLSPRIVDDRNDWVEAPEADEPASAVDMFQCYADEYEDAVMAKMAKRI